MESLKKKAAEAALAYLPSAGSIIGVGTGSTVDYFIQALSQVKHKIDGAVASSEATAQKLKACGIAVLPLPSLSDPLEIYIDGADAVDKHLHLLKGKGGALTREKILAASAKTFVCIADENKHSGLLNCDHVPLCIEVIPMARSYVSRTLVALGGVPVYRHPYITDNGNIILDTYRLDMTEPLKLESTLDQITGVVCHGLFAKRPADILLLGTSQGIKTLNASLKK